MDYFFYFIKKTILIGKKEIVPGTVLFIYRFIDDFLISVDKVVYVQNNAEISL